MLFSARSYSAYVSTADQPLDIASAPFAVIAALPAVILHEFVNIASAAASIGFYAPHLSDIFYFGGNAPRKHSCQALCEVNTCSRAVAIVG